MVYSPRLLKQDFSLPTLTIRFSAHVILAHVAVFQPDVFFHAVWCEMISIP
jgi:hypothetical protein